MTSLKDQPFEAFSLGGWLASPPLKKRTFLRLPLPSDIVPSPVTDGTAASSGVVGGMTTSSGDEMENDCAGGGISVAAAAGGPPASSVAPIMAGV